MSKEARQTFIESESHQSRIINASFKTKKERITMNFTQCYSLAIVSKGNDKNSFYEGLWSIVEKHWGKDMTILMDDLNDEVGVDNNMG